MYIHVGTMMTFLVLNPNVYIELYAYIYTYIHTYICTYI